MTTIVVTGLGAVTALGGTLEETFERVVAGARGFAPVSLFDAGDVRGRLVAEVRALGPESGAADGSSRTTELALVAAREALAEAGLDPRRVRTGLVLAGSTAGLFHTETELAPLLAPAPDRERVAAALARMPSHLLTGPTDTVAARLGPFVRQRSLTSACSSGLNALAVAGVWLELGLVDAVLCGGADALCRVTLSGFNALAAVDPDGARPFDRRRRGLTLGEGAGMLVLERAADARARGRRPICTLLGWAARSEAHHITNPEPTGEAPLRAMRAALERAGLAPGAIDYVNAHGTGTPLNDPMETRALVRLFGESDVGRVRVSTQKGMIGHTLAAAGAIETAITARAIARGIVPPTGGLEEIDPACAPLRHVLAAEPAAIGAALSSSFGFGGMDAAVVLGRPDAEAPSRTRRDVVVKACSVVVPGAILAGAEVAALPGRPLAATRVTLPAGALDPERARRLDPIARLATTAAAAGGGGADPDAGVVLGNAFGLIDATAELMRRFEEKGARMVRPADFPGLVPSSPAGHVSIYLGLHGPAFVVADHAVSGEAAFVQAWELVAAGDADRIEAGAAEDRSPIVERWLDEIFGAGRWRSALPEDDALVGADGKPARAEGAAFLALAPADAAGETLARVGEVWAFSGDGAAPALPAPPAGAVVVVGVATPEVEALLDASAWSACPRIACAPATGAHEATGAMAIAVAAAKLARGEVSSALFLGFARGRGYAGILWPRA